MSDSSGEERPLRPTVRRAERARRAGRLVFSGDLVFAVVVATACIVAVAGGKFAIGHLFAYGQMALMDACRGTAPGQAIRMGLDASGAVLGLPLAAVWVAALLIGLVQTRGYLGGATLRAPGGRIMPRLGRVWRRHGAVDLLLDFCKLALLGAVACWTFASCLPVTLGLYGAETSRILAAFGLLAARVATYLAVALIGLGLADYLLQTRRHLARLRMTRDEAMREHREDEGAAEPKAERHRRHRESQLESRDLREATLVVVDPGRAAVAIAYAAGSSEAPVVMAMGVAALARRIETLAQVEGIPIFIDTELTHMFLEVDVGDEIPQGTYEQVAELMVRVRRQSCAERASLSVGPSP